MTSVGRWTCSISQAVVADLPVPVAPSRTTSCSPRLTRSARSLIAAGWSPAGSKSLTTRNLPWVGRRSVVVRTGRRYDDGVTERVPAPSGTVRHGWDRREARATCPATPDPPSVLGRRSGSSRGPAPPGHSGRGRSAVRDPPSAGAPSRVPAGPAHDAPAVSRGGVVVSWDHVDSVTSHTSARCAGGCRGAPETRRPPRTAAPPRTRPPADAREGPPVPVRGGASEKE